MSAPMTKAEAVALASPARSITFTTWPSKTAPNGKAETMTWDELTALLRDPPKSKSKDECKMLKLARFTHGCKAEDLEAFYGIEGDYDGEAISLDDAAARLSKAGVRAILYTSASYTPDKPRWRVLAPLSRPHTKEEHTATVDLLNGALGGILAPESWTPAQRYFYGQVQGVSYDSRSVEGTCIDEMELVIIPIGKPSPPAPVDKVRPLPASAPQVRAQPAGGVDDLERLATLHGVTAETIDDLRAAVDGLADRRAKDRGEWINVLQALASLKQGAFADEAFEMAQAFSERCQDKFNLDNLTDTWEGMAPTKITHKSIFRMAEEDGWINPRKGVPSAPLLATAESVAVVAATTRRRFPRQSMTEITNRPAPVWRVKGLIPSTGVAMIYGASTSGKSFFALDLGMAIAKGEAWRENHTTKQGTVVYVCAEGADDFTKRVAAYAMHHNIRHLPFEVIDAAPNLMQKADVDELIAELMRAPVGIVFLDTLACMSVGGDENTAKDMAILIAHCKLISKLTGALVVLVHHTGKDETKGARGSSSLYGAMDTVIEISRAGDVRTAKITKQKGGSDGEEFGFKLFPVPVGVDEDGDEITSCVIEHTATVPKAQRKKDPKGTNEIIVIRALQREYDLTGEGVFAAEFITATACELPRGDSTGDKRRFACSRAIETLKEKNRIVEQGGRLTPA